MQVRSWRLVDPPSILAHLPIAIRFPRTASPDADLVVTSYVWWFPNGLAAVWVWAGLDRVTDAGNGGGSNYTVEPQV